MKKILLITFLATLHFANSQQFEFYELDADFLKTFQIGKSDYLIETKNQTCLLMGIKDTSFREIYTGINRLNQTSQLIRINSATLKDNLLFISTSSSNRIINIRDNSLLVDSSAKYKISISYLNENNEIIGITENGEVLLITLDDDHVFKYHQIKKISPPAIKYFDDESIYVITENGEVLNSMNLDKVITSIDNFTSPSNVNITEDFIIFEYPQYFNKYDKNFEFIKRFGTNKNYYVSKNKGYLVPEYKKDTMLLYEFNDDLLLIDSSFYILNTALRINNFLCHIENESSIFLFSNRKYITSYDKVDRSFTELSMLNLPKEFYIGETDFFNTSIGGICGDVNSVYLTKNGGVTWKRFYEFNAEGSTSSNFTSIKFMSENSFFATGNWSKGTILSDDFGDSYINSNNPRGMDYGDAYFDILGSGNFIQTYYYISLIGVVQSFKKYDKYFNSLKDTYLLDYNYLQAARVKDKIKSISYITDTNPYTFYVVEVDTSLNEFKIDPLGGNVERPNGIVNYKDKFYMPIRFRDNNKQYLLSSSNVSVSWDTVLTSNEMWYYDIYSQNNNLYILDSNYVINKINLESKVLEPIVALPKSNVFIKTFTLLNDVIYLSYGKDFFKGIKIPEFSTKSSVIVEIVPTFSSHPPYPLPSKENVNIKLDYDQRYDTEDIKLEIYNSNGALLNNILTFSTTTLSSYQINLRVNLSEYKQGVYFIKVMFGNKSEYIPIVRN